MKKTAIFTLGVLLITTILASFIYKIIGIVSGQDAICLSGLIVGSIASFIVVYKKGHTWVLPTFISAQIISIPLIVVSILLKNVTDDLVHVIWPLAIGFGITSGSVLGLMLGQHLTSGFSGSSLRSHH